VLVCVQVRGCMCISFDNVWCVVYKESRMQTQQRTLLLTHSLTHLIPTAIAAAAVQHPAVEAHRVPLLEPGSHWRTGGYQRFLGPDAGVEYVVRGRYVRLGQKRGVAHVPLDVLAEGECRESV
jgi:hypothetical protein